MEPPDTFTPEPAQPTRTPLFSGARRLVTTVVLAIGLMAAGGVAVVTAATPAPTSSPAATASAGTSGGTASPAPSHDCPAHSSSSTGSSS